MSDTGQVAAGELPPRVAAHIPLAREILARCDALAQLSSMPDGLCRTYLSSEHKAANEKVGQWMAAAGMAVDVDAVGNVYGRYAPADQRSYLVVGSHLDTVPNAGKYDGMLGVLCGIAVVAQLHDAGIDLPFGIEVVGFGEEEGVRFGATLMGSRAFAGTWDKAWADLTDDAGVTVAAALDTFGLDVRNVAAAARDPQTLIGYLELHIEQGPVLEAANLPVGIVTGIAGAHRLQLVWRGTAAHAGTTPMTLRRDALAGAAEAVRFIEATARELGIVATVGQLEVEPGGVNVIPGRVVMSLDVRSVEAQALENGLAALLQGVQTIADNRQLNLEIEELHAAAPVSCAASLRQACVSAIEGLPCQAFELPSGAGHDAMAIASVCDVGMIFLRCAEGLSHNPAESITETDVAWGVTALLDTVRNVADTHAGR